MLYLHLLLVSILSNVLLMADIAIQDPNRHQSIKITPLYTAEVPKEIRDNTNKELLQEDVESTEESEFFCDEDIDEMELALETAPKKAQIIAQYLQDPTCFPSNINLRSAFFVGEPGSGKTMTAKAIAYKMAQKGWECKIISSTSFFGEYRNQTAIQLQKELEAIALSKKPTILIIDEIHRLLENSESKHHDTDATAVALWTFLDKQERNKNFFLIGTMNRADKLPKPFKSRMLSGYIPFPLIADSKFKNKLLRKHLTTSETSLDKEVTDTFLDEELKKIDPCSGRDLKLISKNILLVHTNNKEKRPSLIKKETIIHEINEYISHKTAIKYDAKEESDKERQERHHIENMNLQKAHHGDQMLLQEINTAIQIAYFMPQIIKILLPIPPGPHFPI